LWLAQGPRYADAVASARRELPYTHELAYAARCLLELVEAAVRTGEHALAEEAFEHLASVAQPAGIDWAVAIVALAEALLRDGDEAESLYLDAIERFERIRVPIYAARSTLSPVARSSRAARSANACIPQPNRISCAARRCSRASTRRCRRRSVSS
jgi:hypothetical protein